MPSNHGKHRWPPIGGTNTKEKLLDKTEECKDCDICQMNCMKWIGYTGYGAKCPIHDVWRKQYDENGEVIREGHPYDTAFFRGMRRPYLRAHWCEEHKMFHCLRHAVYCMKVFGAAVMRWVPPTEYELKEIEEMKRIDAETCKMHTWSDQIEYRIIRCAECNGSVCSCDPLNFKSLGIIVCAECRKWKNCLCKPGNFYWITKQRNNTNNPERTTRKMLFE